MKLRPNVALAAVFLAPALASAQYRVESTANGWSSHRYNYGSVGSSVQTHPHSTASGTTDATGDARAAYSEAHGSSEGYPHSFDTHGDLYGFANLGTASVGTSDSDTAVDGSYVGYDGGTSHGRFEDVLTFSVAGGNASTVTEIGITFTQRGHLRQSGTWADGHGETTADFVFGSNGFLSSGARFRTDLKLDGTSGYMAYINYADTYPSTGPFTTITLTPDLIVIHETLTLMGSSITVPVAMGIDSFDGGGMDMASTAFLALDLPRGVTLGSSSGIFATQAGTRSLARFAGARPRRGGPPTPPEGATGRLTPQGVDARSPSPEARTSVRQDLPQQKHGRGAVARALSTRVLEGE